MTGPGASVAEVRGWAQGLGLPVKDRGRFPIALFDRWDREHPGRPSERPQWAYQTPTKAFPRTPEELLARGRRAGAAAVASKRGDRP